ncbi:MAG: hypothetical protein IPJ41_01800 [Phycisphaerales bacterium]|nr:hypothetical protein [Phycisphaerales bacterium]
MRRPPPSPVPFCVALAAAALGLAGCKSAQQSRPEPAATFTPVVRSAEAGLEARLWVISNQSGLLPAVFRDYHPPAALGAQADTWRQNGLRVLEVPIDRLDEVRAALPTIGPLHREWLGLLPEWVEVVKGSRIEAERLVQLDDGVVRLGPGALRLLARCWTTPSVGAQPDGSPAGAVLRVEIMPELMMQSDRGDEPLQRLLSGEPVHSGPGVRGVAFQRMLLRLVSGGQNAIVIVPEDPSAAWEADAPNRPESGLDSRRDQPAFGPQAPVLPTLGELMLTSLAQPETVGDARVIVVLVPIVPDRFELLPR